MSTQVKEIPTSSNNLETSSQGSGEGSAASTTCNEIPNPKYKTTLCRNYINSLSREQLNNIFSRFFKGLMKKIHKLKLIYSYKIDSQCNRHSGCHFAHGSEELRAVSENSNFFAEVEKSNTDYLNKWPTNIPTNYKTTICKFYEQVGTCKYDQNCNYAHGDQEKRKIPENIQSQLKNARNTHKHINNSAGHKNQQQQAMQQYMLNNQYLQQYIVQYFMSQQQTCILDLSHKILVDTQDEYVKKTINDIKKLVEETKIKQALTQLKRLCSRKDATKKEQEILKEVEKYLQASQQN